MFSRLGIIILLFISTSVFGSEYDFVKRLNIEVNSTVRYVSDMENYGVADYWATPEETMERGGDCEDIAILKYYKLKMAGIPVSKLKLGFVFEKRLTQNHIVLMYQDLVLDNTTDDMIPISERYDLVLFYSFNDNGMYNAMNKRISHSVAIDKWNSVRAKF